MAAVALFAIVVGIVWTWVLVVVSSFSSSNMQTSQDGYSPEELQEFIESLSWASLSGANTQK